MFFAIAYKTPAKKPTDTAETDPNVTASPKKIMPDAATGSLLSAPVMLQYQAIVNRRATFPKPIIDFSPIRRAAGHADAPGCSI